MNEQRIGKYQILEKLGWGGFATVYKARDLTLDRVVALKVLHPHLVGDSGFVTRFRNEARAAANLRHPNIVTVYEIGEADGRPYIAMEYLTGRTLHALLSEVGKLDLERVYPILVQIARALDYAHTQGLVHRDVKPANIIIDESRGVPRVTLTDFGLVKAISDSGALTSAGTAPGTVMGTPAYMAPEQADSTLTAQVGPATDRYALGVVAYEMLTGNVPFPGNTPAILYAHVHTPPPDPRQFVIGLPPAISDTLLKMLSKAPGERFPTATSFVLQFKDVLLAHRKRLKQDERLVTLYRQMQTALAQERWPDALALGQRVQQIEPDYQDLPALMLQARKGLEHAQGAGRIIPPWFWAFLGTFGLVMLAWGIMQSAGLSFYAPVLETQTPAPTLTPTPILTPVVTPSPSATLVPQDDPYTPPAGEFSAGHIWLRRLDGMLMVYVPAGELAMGSMTGNDDEKPVHSVQLDAFWIDQTEVTNGQYRQCVGDGVCTSPITCTWGIPTYGDTTMGAHPVTCVDWAGAQAYCEWAGGRLPTEAEWEYAARGPYNHTYSWGNDWRGGYANCSESLYRDGYEGTAPVGSFARGESWCKAQDLTGNAWEWVADWYGPYTSGLQANPLGPLTGDGRILRGGSWVNSDTANLRSSFRLVFNQDLRYSNIGFRCAFDAE